MNEAYKIIFKFIKDSDKFCYEQSQFNKIQELNYLFIKNTGNIAAIEILLSYKQYNNFYQEASTILRSFIESSINFIYLLFFEKERLLYLEDSQLLVFKNNFMWHKKLLKNPHSIIEQLDVNITQIEAELINSFNKLSGNNKTKILNGIKQKIFTINDDTYLKLDDFLRNYKSKFMNIRKMWDELFKANITINGLTFKDMLNEAYNEYSQITHTIFPIEQKLLKNKIFDIIRTCFTINNVIIAVLRNKYYFDLSDTLIYQLKECSNLIESYRPVDF